jgi:hypothetical protein
MKVDSLQKNKSEESSKTPRYFILVGDEGTWKAALEHQQWGFTQKSFGHWRTINEGDFVAFYVTTPIKKIIGFAKITEKFVSKDFIWPDEKFFKRSLWGNRIRFEILTVLENWEDGIGSPPNIVLNIGRKVVERKIFALLIKNASKKWKIKFTKNYNKVIEL